MSAPKKLLKLSRTSPCRFRLTDERDLAHFVGCGHRRHALTVSSCDDLTRVHDALVQFLSHVLQGTQSHTGVSKLLIKAPASFRVDQLFSRLQQSIKGAISFGGPLMQYTPFKKLPSKTMGQVRLLLLENEQDHPLSLIESRLKQVCPGGILLASRDISATPRIRSYHPSPAASAVHLYLPTLPANFSRTKQFLHSFTPSVSQPYNHSQAATQQPPTTLTEMLMRMNSEHDESDTSSPEGSKCSDKFSCTSPLQPSSPRSPHSSRRRQRNSESGSYSEIFECDFSLSSSLSDKEEQLGSVGSLSARGRRNQKRRTTEDDKRKALLKWDRLISLCLKAEKPEVSNSGVRAVDNPSRGTRRSRPQTETHAQKVSSFVPMGTEVANPSPQPEKTEFQIPQERVVHVHPPSTQEPRSVVKIVSEKFRKVSATRSSSVPTEPSHHLRGTRRVAVANSESCSISPQMPILIPATRKEQKERQAAEVVQRQEEHEWHWERQQWRDAQQRRHRRRGDDSPDPAPRDFHLEDSRDYGGRRFRNGASRSGVGSVVVGPASRSRAPRRVRT
eukprot:gb/GEZN01002672.1/.p1 GENE.gb/GEZN01002672.1/~~gb/GEZN01002672.1/.p1  ORF type:complete len:560 (-),score=53.00 gb/GEZN01002672.1/:656-2335(-)